MRPVKILNLRWAHMCEGKLSNVPALLLLLILLLLTLLLLLLLLLLSSSFIKKIHSFNVNSVDPDQAPRSAASDLFAYVAFSGRRITNHL